MARASQDFWAKPAGPQDTSRPWAKRVAHFQVSGPRGSAHFQALGQDSQQKTSRGLGQGFWDPGVTSRAWAIGSRSTSRGPLPGVRFQG